jgi:oligopeptide/dipeptide ABC transporter ATP-binding protein
MTALLEVEGLGKTFQAGGRSLRAVDDVSFSVAEGETLGVVGESGCGKTTLGRMVLRLLEPTEGRIRFAGQDITRLPEAGMRRLRKDMQVVFQDPFSSLNPRWRVRDIVAEPLVNLGWPRRRIAERVEEAVRTVGLPPDALSRYPHAFSGGQRQRIGIARALAPSPRLIVCDEAVSALDVSIQAQVLNLLADIQAEYRLVMLFISHNLAVVRHVSHRVAVMYLGQVVEMSSEDALFRRPLHPYTAALISAVPDPEAGAERRRIVLQGEIPSPMSPPSGCRFHTRCPIARDRCRTEAPVLAEAEPGRLVRCHFPGEVAPP